MIFKKLIRLGFLAILLFAFLGAFGSIRQARTNDAYWAGYLAGQQAAASEDSTVNPAPPMSPYGYDTHYRGHRGFFPGAGLLLCILPFMFFGFMSMMFGCKRRHWKHGPGGPGHWHQHGPWQGGGKPVWEDENFENEPPKEA
ncbi:MAG: hypothetical protein IAF02_17230 [Anaerolineae bacterium]|nr:hypothetical protein [Anaerolineae bacterium]